MDTHEVLSAVRDVHFAYPMPARGLARRDDEPMHAAMQLAQQPEKPR
ncbi:hypothetical protein H3V53_39245 [Paraburkholderia bengalensis]|uniref:Uncharacterized protein n=1 Tax=Paraburkholderia bengalensis TaxID=2747562 RepID=A0ABU8J5S3_9BURK